MITHRLDPTDVLSDRPAPRRRSRLHDEPGSAPRPLRAQRRPPVRRRPDRSPHPRRPRRARRPVPRPGVQPGHDHLGLPLARSSATTTAAATPWRGSSPTGRPAAWRPARPTRPATATPAAASPPASCAPWRRRTAQELQAGAAGGVEVERAERVHRRRVARLHARHAGEPGGLPAAGGAAAGDRLPAGPGRRAAVAGDRRLPRPGHRPVRGQGHRRDHAAAADVRLAVARRRGPGRRPVRQLLPRLRAARARHRAGRPRAGGAGGEPDGGEPARRRRHPLAAAQQAARDDGGAVPPLPRRAC